MEADTENGMETGPGDCTVVENAVANDTHGRHDEQARVLPSAGLDLKLSVAMEAYRSGGQRGGMDESSPDTPDQLEQLDKDKEKGRKRRKYRRVRPNKKVWLWRKELAEVATGVAGPVAREGSSAALALPAPNNTTQFIMEDHKDLQELNLEAQRGARTTRSRDPSFSIDSEEEFSSSYEEESYLSKEFSSTYEDVHGERLDTMSKVDLIQEYLLLEQRVDVLEKKLKCSQNTGSGANDSGGNCGTGTDSDSEVAEGEMPIEPAMAEKIRIFQEEIKKLRFENNILAQENQRLQSSSSLVRPSSSSLTSSIDSESDSSTTSGSSSSSSHSEKSRSSRSSGQKSCDEIRTDTMGDKNSDVEMLDVVNANEVISKSTMQEMDTELPAEEETPKETSSLDDSVKSPVPAH